MTHAKPGSVVVGYDGSDHAAAALDWAAAEAARRQAPLHVVYAADYPGLVPGPVGGSPWLPERAVEAANEIPLEGVVRARGRAPELEVTHHTDVGSAAGALVDEAEGAALLVVGTRGHGGLAGALLGSVAFAVSGHAPCPVVVVRGDGSRMSGPDRPVVAGVDGSRAAEAALHFAARIAAETSAPLVLIGAWHPPAGETWEAAYWGTMAPAGQLGAAAERATLDVLDRARQAVTAAHPDLEIRAEAVGGSAGHALADASKGAGMVVVGARGRGGFTGLLLGSVSHDVIHRASCPVAVVRG